MTRRMNEDKREAFSRGRMGGQGRRFRWATFVLTHYVYKLTTQETSEISWQEDCRGRAGTEAVGALPGVPRERIKMRQFDAAVPCKQTTPQDAAANCLQHPRADLCVLGAPDQPMQVAKRRDREAIVVSELRSELIVCAKVRPAWNNITTLHPGGLCAW